MGPLSLIAIIVLISGIIQITYPELFITLHVHGTKNLKAVKVGGIITILVSIILFLIDLLPLSQ
ncbi:hypothetical protein AM231_15040 [Paenibacillus solani]|uniref:Uncharacterized protein n=1 Tax=Paenibacillus solani TaxID=1705565 RepID=A0A0M1P7J9_9BACL|nr:hypothetical protein AM231_15040 [Paenibacillus solani]